jgi:hypothetical protein
MREFIGHKIRVATKAIGVVEGLMIDDRKDVILVKGADGVITRIIKTDIGGFAPVDFEPFEYIPFHVLFCENKRTLCPGVQYVKEGEGFSRHDVEKFVGPCPCRYDDCSIGTKGELRSVSGKVLRDMLNDTMFGEYPKKEGEHGSSKGGAECRLGGDSGVNSKGCEAAPKGQGKGRGGTTRA